MTIQTFLEQDATVLLERALLNHDVVAFGEDGLGKYGTSDRPKYYLIQSISVSLEIDEDDVVTGEVAIGLLGYNAMQFGHICTDKNFEISIRKLLSDFDINPNVLKYAPIEAQGDQHVMMSVDVEDLLQWS